MLSTQRFSALDAASVGALMLIVHRLKLLSGCADGRRSGEEHDSLRAQIVALEQDPPLRDRRSRAPEGAQTARENLSMLRSRWSFPAHWGFYYTGRNVRVSTAMARLPQSRGPACAACRIE
jgi:hypothetical protein